MSRNDNRSLKIRGVPRQVLGRLDTLAAGRATTRNAFMRELVEGYASGRLTPSVPPPPFDPNRGNAIYGPDTAPLAISGVPPATFAKLMTRAKAEGWHSKNALLVELLRDATGDRFG